MPYTFIRDYGGGVVMTPCWITFLEEVESCLDLLPGLINSGQLGNRSHAEQGINSDHNPFVQSPITGLWYLRAADFSGPRASWYKLLEFWNYMYKIQDPRVYPYGYTNSDVQDNKHGLTIWFSAGITRNGSDGPHAHMSSSRANTNRTGTAAWNVAMESTRPWGLRSFLTSGTTTASLGNETIIKTEEDDMAEVWKSPSYGAAVLLGTKLIPVGDLVGLEDAKTRVVSNDTFLRALKADSLFIYISAKDRGVASFDGVKATPVGSQVNTINKISSAGLIIPGPIDVDPADFDRWVARA